MTGDVAKGIKVLKGMSDDSSTNNQDDNSKSDNSDSEINNKNASNWMVRILSVVIIAILVLGLRNSYCTKKSWFLYRKSKIH